MRLSPPASPQRTKQATHVQRAHPINWFPLGTWLCILFPPGKYSMHIWGYIIGILIPLSSQNSSVEDGTGIFICTFQISKMRPNLLGDLPRVIQLTGSRALSRIPIFRLPGRNVSHHPRAQAPSSSDTVQNKTFTELILYIIIYEEIYHWYKFEMKAQTIVSLGENAPIREIRTIPIIFLHFKIAWQGRSAGQRSKAESAIAFKKLIPQLTSMDIKVLYEQKESKKS